MGARSGSGVRIGSSSGYARNPELDTPRGKARQQEYLAKTFDLGIFAANPKWKGAKGWGGLKDDKVTAEIRDAIEQYSKEIGLSEGMYFDVGTLPKGRVAKNQGYYITLSRDYYNRSYDATKKKMDALIKSGFSVEAKNSIRRNIYHELAHRTYHSLSGRQQSQVEALYNRFVNDKTLKGWGRYSKTTAGEFYAEGIAKSLGGKADYYTKELRKLSWYQYQPFNK